MTVRLAAVGVSLFLASVAVAFVAFGGLSEPTAASGSESTTTTGTTDTAAEPEAPAYFVNPNETRIGSIVLTPVSLEVLDDTINLDFETASLAPGAEAVTRDEVAEDMGFGASGAPMDRLFAVEWRLTTTDGAELVGEITNPEVTIVRFPTESPIDEADIESIEILRYLVATPLDVRFTLSEGSPTEAVFPGASVTLLRTTQQDDQGIVEIEATSDLPIQARWIHVAGEGPEWRSSVRTSQGGASWSLAWVGGELPTDIPFRATGTAWLEGNSPVAIDLVGLR